MTHSLSQADAQFFRTAWSAPADSDQVWCTFAGRQAGTNDGFCRYCGSTQHLPAGVTSIELNCTPRRPQRLRTKQPAYRPMPQPALVKVVRQEVSR